MEFWIFFLKKLIRILYYICTIFFPSVSLPLVGCNSVTLVVDLFISTNRVFMVRWSVSFETPGQRIRVR